MNRLALANDLRIIRCFANRSRPRRQFLSFDRPQGFGHLHTCRPRPPQGSTGDAADGVAVVVEVDAEVMEVILQLTDGSGRADIEQADPPTAESSAVGRGIHEGNLGQTVEDRLDPMVGRQLDRHEDRVCHCLAANAAA